MKRIIKITAILFILSILNSNGAYAQVNSVAPQKLTVIIGDFTRSNEITSANLSTIRNNVMLGFTKKGRFNVIDATQEATLLSLNQKRGETEDVVNETNILDESHANAYKALGANYLITGSATKRTCTRSTTSDGKVQYTTHIYFSLKGFDIITGETLAADQYDLMGIAKSPELADASAISSVDDKMNKYINKNFPFETRILQLNEVKKKKLFDLYIHCGSYIGVKKGDTFLVYKLTSIAGITSKKEIGKLTVSEVEGEELSKCKVTKGNEEILNEFNSNPENLIVVSLGQNAAAAIGDFFK